jgi:hypothetical protein
MQAVPRQHGTAYAFIGREPGQGDALGISENRKPSQRSGVARAVDPGLGFT